MQIFARFDIAAFLSNNQPMDIWQYIHRIPLLLLFLPKTYVLFKDQHNFAEMEANILKGTKGEEKKRGKIRLNQRSNNCIN